MLDGSIGGLLSGVSTPRNFRTVVCTDDLGGVIVVVFFWFFLIFLMEVGCLGAVSLDLDAFSVCLVVRFSEGVLLAKSLTAVCREEVFLVVLRLGREAMVGVLRFSMLMLLMLFR